MKKVRIDLGNNRFAEFELDNEDSIMFAKFTQGIDWMDVTKFWKLFDIDFIKTQFEHSQTEL